MLLLLLLMLLLLRDELGLQVGAAVGLGTSGFGQLPVKQLQLLLLQQQQQQRGLSAPTRPQLHPSAALERIPVSVLEI